MKLYLNKEYHPINKLEQNTKLFRPNLYSRRSFLKQAAAMGAAGLGLPSLLTACSNERGMKQLENKTGPTGETAAERPVPKKCESIADLTAGDKTARQAINYVDKSPQMEKVCANCQFFKQPGVDAACGGCEIVGGPIAPAGYCNAWVAQG